MTVALAGDVMLDGGPGHAIVHGRDPFAEFARTLRAADIAVCNLECVLAPGGQQVLKPYTFRGPREAIPLLKEHFTAVGLANNHTGDFGKDAFRRQLEMLDEAGLPYFGGGRDRAEARRPLILKRNGLRVALLGYNGFPPRAFEAGQHEPGVAWLHENEVLEDIKSARARADVVVPFVHWGREMRSTPEDWQRDLARRMIDAGAAAVIGAHPHVVQTVERYHGRPIIYSLGNFVFDYYPVDPPVWIGWIATLRFSKAGDVGLGIQTLQIDKEGIPHPVPGKE